MGLTDVTRQGQQRAGQNGAGAAGTALAVPGKGAGWGGKRLQWEWLGCALKTELATVFTKLGAT